MALIDILAGCCPFLKSSTEPQPDEPPLLNSDGSPNESGFEPEDPLNQTQSPRRHQSSEAADPNNNDKKHSSSDSENDDFEDDTDEDDNLEETDDDDEEDLQADCVKDLDKKLLDVVPKASDFDKENFREKRLLYQKQVCNVEIGLENVPQIVLSRRKLLNPVLDDSNKKKFLGGPQYFANSSTTNFDIDPSVILMLNSTR